LFNRTTKKEKGKIWEPKRKYAWRKVKGQGKMGHHFLKYITKALKDTNYKIKFRTNNIFGNTLKCKDRDKRNKYDKNGV
jgi:hypothetical protein